MQIIAHRGAKGYVSENTIAAFRKALEMGADGIELDVHLSSDGQIMVFHDEHTDRLTGVSGTVKDMACDDLQKLKVDLHHEIPTLAKVLDFVDKRCLVNIELKVEAAARPVTQLIEKYVSEGWNYDHFLVSSFDWTALQEIRNRNPKIPLGVLTETDLDLAIGFAKSINAETLHPYFHLLDEASVKKIKAENLRLYVWTVNEPEDISRIENFGIDGIITDFPDRA
ncbi:glycerophosphodiester phosphodiesterase [Flavobacterium sp. MAH-1]|uniref:Glycerophosphodiester phosphodiesterase n=1 Tax=Flavobacterium agri TaxID=2743471 RepID=A0A7Y9C6T0_9FLAO|nr:glycerophosphodiester phosphodiesterase family protein [Flavobacterium agri]NUY80689.1 glycerophosphodiester phosphodiesterase [Flavobacterium agri]NYA70713.1 glycerophosphodiester phosphodiesterase [Flavobacterium agri]